ncbi:hypothetical protein DYY65_05720 [Nitrososphaera sp. AFS]|nr:hypothetical protein [Nitrososphaera sp. AFS]
MKRNSKKPGIHSSRRGYLPQATVRNECLPLCCQDLFHSILNNTNLKHFATWPLTYFYKKVLRSNWLQRLQRKSGKP